MFRVVLICVLLAVVKGRTTEVNQCTANPGPLPVNAHIEGCTTQPCLLPQGQNVVVNIIFQAPRLLASMRTLATAYVAAPIIGFAPVNYNLGDQQETCKFLANTYCPVLQGEVVQYTLKMFIESFFPVDTQVPIEFRIVDQNNSPVTCIRVVIRITPPLTNTFGAFNATNTV